MGYTIAIAGKGGVGKTTVASLIVRSIAEKSGKSVLAVDADPNSNLAETLGIAPKQTIGQLVDEVARHPELVPAGMPKDRFLEYQIQTAVQEAEGFDLVTMGRPEGPGCYCYVNTILRNVMAKLIKEYDYIVIDNEAGLEHLSRRTTRTADVLLVVSDPTSVGLKAARRITELVGELEIAANKKLLVVNRSSRPLEPPQLAGIDLEYIGDIPVDDAVYALSLDGGSLWGLDTRSSGMQAIYTLGEKIWQRN